MLILSRKKDEKIVIDDEIQIQIVDIRSDTVKIGINAPKHVKVYREEVWNNIQAENRQAAIEKDPPHTISKSLSDINEHLTLQHEGSSSHIEKEGSPSSETSDKEAITPSSEH